MNRFQPIYDIAEIFAKKNITEAVLCPGSRCAPLTLSFTRHPGIRTRTISDERSAAFIALGIAQQVRRTTALICTSGSAVYNFSPAVAEAFFSQTPLVIITADRPVEWIAQHDGQTIHQNEIFGKHVKKFYQLPQDYEHPDAKWAVNRIVNEAINFSMQEPAGPVHINAPFREPLYPKADDAFTFSDDVRIIEEVPQTFALSEETRSHLKHTWSSFHRILIVAGQHTMDPDMCDTLNQFCMRHNVPVITDIISNLHSLDQGVRHADLFLGQVSADVVKSFRPDLLITFGKSVISKNVKLFLRNHPPKEHWHIQPGGITADTFQHMTKVIHADPQSFFEFLNTLERTENFENQKQRNYNNLWWVEERKTLRNLEEYFPQEPFAELEVVKEILSSLPAKCNLHLANSMSVRYANFIGLSASQHGAEVFSNRGTSGIDGCTSTAVGASFATDIPNVLITGDMAFFYDRNAFWHNYPVENLRVVILNNHGGIIFGMIDGPGALPEAEEYFITRQRLNAKKLCEEFDLVYLKLDHRRKLKNLLKDFFDFDGKTKILEIESDTVVNKMIFDNLKQKIKKSYEL